MTEMILNTSTLPEPLYRLIRSEKVKVREVNGEIRLTPVVIAASKGCPLRGMCPDGKISSYDFMQRKRAEKELEC